MKKGIIYLIMVLCVLILSSIYVNAATNLPVRLNVTLTETVYRNTTYGSSAVEWGENTTSCLIRGILNITNPFGDWLEDNITINDILVSFERTANMLTNFSWSSGRIGYQVNWTEDNFTVYIPELRRGNYSQFVYNVSCMDVDPPLSMDTKYTGLNTGINRKVLAGENWTITQNVSNALKIGEDITDINVQIYVNSIFYNKSNSSTLMNFSLTKLQQTGDYLNVTQNATPGSPNKFNWNWSCGGGTISPSQEFNISYAVSAPNQTYQSGIYLAITENLVYSVPYSTSNLTITKIIATGPAYFKEKKKIIQPADNNPNSTNVTWQADGFVNTSYNVSYNLKQVSLWVTQSLNPTNTSTEYGELNKTYLPNQRINISGFWYTPTHDDSWLFNFTDGSVGNSPPPIVWMKPYFEITNAYNQIMNSSYTQSGNDYYMKYVYVVNGYWLQVGKNITNVANNSYDINITVENIGNAWTPSGLTVTVYDFVPVDFKMGTPTQAESQKEYVNTTVWNGTAYRWNIPRKIPFNASLGPKTEIVSNRRWSVKYNVNGSGEYSISDLYVVGLDPRQVDGAGSHEGITIISSFSSRTKEIIYLVGLIALIGLNILNFVMTRRINKRI